jgi:hypothetical protein
MHAVTGASDHVDSFRAGREAADQARAAQAHPDVLLCFASVHTDQAAVLAGIRTVFPDTPLVGGSSGATITETGWRKRAVALMGLQSDAIRFATGTGLDTHQDAHAAGRQAAAAVRARLDGSVRTLIPLPQAVVGCDHPAFLAGLQAILPETLIVGGASAMDGMLDPAHPLFLKSFQYHGSGVQEHTAPVLGLDWADGRLHDACAWGHGFMPIGIAAQVTRATGNVVQEIDDQPALDYFRKYLGGGFDFRVDAALLPLGLTETYDAGTTTMRVSPALEPMADGSVRYIIPIATGQTVQLVRTTRTELIQSARTTAETLQARLLGRRPGALFMFSCGGRHALLGDRCADELKQVQDVFGPEVPLIGLQAGGEFAPMAERRGTYRHPGMYGQWQTYSLCLYAIAA